MSTPKTLLQLSGAPLHPAPLDKAALLLIDFQREYTDGALPLPGAETAIAEAASLLALARAKGVPVVHVVHHGAAGGALFNPEGPLSAIVPALAPLDGEAVVVKKAANAFAGTALQDRLRETGRTELIVAGFMTHNCVGSTVRAAVDLGWRNTVVAAATGTRDLPDGVGGVVPAAVLNRAELAGLGDRMAVIVETTAAWS
ncbi:isochorismatase family protein [Azospirillum agricola]|uniref:isochorismatase family protein n=1 Tax=Azospirillum agricola TaxID=1720247 RepID=UPI000A0F0453|nr:isochorismatase family protein [Azospirillum agricola]SMH57820.1 Nicotinamidase-related amidase [Azospirillum lipoferum]